MAEGESQTTEDMMRDIGTAMVVGEACERVLKLAVEKGVNAIAVKMAKSQLMKRVSKSTMGNVVKAVKKRIMKMLKQILQTRIIKILKNLATRTTAKAGATLGKTAATSGGVFLAGCTGGAPGCAAGAAVGAAIFIWDCFNIVWDLMDTHGLTIVFNEKMIQGIGEGMRDSVNEAFATLSEDPYLDTEVFFEPLSLVFVTDENDNLMLSEEWGPLYFKHIHHYMTKIKGHPENWEDFLPSAVEVEEEEKSKLIGGINKLPQPTMSNQFVYLGFTFVIFFILIIIIIIILSATSK